MPEKTEVGKEPHKNEWPSLISKFMEMFGGKDKSKRPETGTEYKKRREDEELEEVSQISHPALKTAMAKLEVNDDEPAEKGGFVGMKKKEKMNV